MPPHECKYDREINSMIAETQRMAKTMYGNGQPGILTIVTQLDTKMDMITKTIGELHISFNDYKDKNDETVFPLKAANHYPKWVGFGIIGMCAVTFLSAFLWWRSVEAEIKNAYMKLENIERLQDTQLQGFQKQSKLFYGQTRGDTLIQTK